MTSSDPLFPTYVGVDGCRGGWCYVALCESGLNGGYQAGISKTIQSLIDQFPDQARYFIDMPIGLIDQAPGHRSCDLIARKKLGKRRHSVFAAPCRAVLETADYQQACAISRQQIGKALSRQSYHLIPKIRELDQYLTKNPNKHANIFECHPELCFYALNNSQAMQHNKKTPSGYLERLAVLADYLSDSAQIVAQVLSEYPRRTVLRDDIVDALCNAIGAQLSADGLVQIPDKSEHDLVGMPMRICYAKPHR